MQGNDTGLSQFSMQGKVALVTGAGKGIGRACAERFVAAGARVIAVARTESDLQELREQCGESVEAWPQDVRDTELLERIENLDQLDVLVNNVGTNKPQPIVDVEDEALDLMLDLNVRSAFLVARAATRVMTRQGSGSIVHMSSQMGHVGAVNRSVYCMTKHALEGLSKAMAVELAPLGIRVNCVAPTFIETPLTEPILAKPGFREEVLQKILLQRIGKVEEVADAVLFLASPAASLITGDSLKVDGGWTAV